MSQRAIDRLYTVEEFERMPEFSEGYELIDGRIVKKPMPFADHAIIADAIRDAIRDYDRKMKLGRAQREASIDIGIKGNAPIPDVSYWKAEKNVKARAKLAPLPDLAVEVLSDSDTVSPSALRSAMVKVKKLIKANVPIVWVINPRLRIAEVYRAGQLQPVRILREGQDLEGEEVIPGFKLALSDLFEEIEEE